MTANVTPMIHVPDVRATVDWYVALGFTLVATHPDEGELDWALLAFGAGRVMLSEGGRPSTAARREMDLYVHTEQIAALAERLRPRVEVIEDVHDTLYGMRELIIRDLNGFWVTFGENILPL